MVFLIFIVGVFAKACRPTRHKLRWYPINQYVAGERGQSPLLYMGSPYLEFLDLGEGEGL